MTESSSTTNSTSSPPILFLHGYCEGSWIWESVCQTLHKEYSCLALDLPGFANGDALPDELSILSIASIIWKKLDHQKIKTCILIGHSLGGYVALAMAELRPAEVKGLMLFHSTPFADSAERKENRNKVISFVEQHGSKSFLDSFAPGLFREPDSVVAQDFRKAIANASPEAVTYYAKAMRDRPDRTAIFKALQIPKLVLGGRFDPIISPDVCRQIQEAGGDAELLILEASAHAGMLEEPEKSLEIIREFAKKCL